jgi:type IV pilus assembly protein PilA
MASHPPPPQQPYQQQYPYPPPARSGGGGAAIGIVIGVVGALLALVAVIGVLAVLAIYGVRKYIANAKTMEARSGVRVMATDAAAVYSSRSRLCPSASEAVPRDIAAVRGRKYLSAPSDWSKDKERDAGFSCLGFSMSMPQYYQYDYRAEPSGGGIVAIAHGDLNADGIASSFELQGDVTQNGLVIAPSMLETNPDE